MTRSPKRAFRIIIGLTVIVALLPWRNWTNDVGAIVSLPLTPGVPQPWPGTVHLEPERWPGAEAITNAESAAVGGADPPTQPIASGQEIEYGDSSIPLRLLRVSP